MPAADCQYFFRVESSVCAKVLDRKFVKGNGNSPVGDLLLQNMPNSDSYSIATVVGMDLGDTRQKTQLDVSMPIEVVARFGVKHIEVHLSQKDHLPPSTSNTAATNALKRIYIALLYPTSLHLALVATGTKLQNL